MAEPNTTKTASSVQPPLEPPEVTAARNELKKALMDLAMSYKNMEMVVGVTFAGIAAVAVTSVTKMVRRMTAAAAPPGPGN